MARWSLRQTWQGSMGDGAMTYHLKEYVIFLNALDYYHKALLREIRDDEKVGHIDSNIVTQSLRVQKLIDKVYNEVS